LEPLTKLLNWFAGGDTPYMTMRHCMNGDWFWIILTIALDAAVATGYGLIAMHWWRNARRLPATPAKAALANMRNIFLFCGICGYTFIPIKMFWPAWRLYDIVMLALVYFTWKYAWSARELKVIYSELGRTDQLAKDLRQSQEESRKKSFFLNAISHDLRTPLNGLVLQTALAKMSVTSNDPEALKTSLLEIEASARATADMLDRLLEYARLNSSDEPNSRQRFPLAELLNESAHCVAAECAARNLFINAKCPAHLYITTDRVKLERILSNLVGNALKFTRQGGIKIDAQVAPGGLELHVIDTGIGIAPEHREKLFEEFYQVGNEERDRGKGFGLGLAIVRQLVHQLGGDITVESALGQGTSFTVILPGVFDASDGNGSPRNHAPAQGADTVAANI
jgi:signal transduction histidine kinase